MRTKTAALLGIIAGLSTATATFAGLRLGGSVVVSPSGMYAYGNVAVAYNTNTNYSEAIGCTMYVLAGGFTYGACWASDAAGVSRSCFTRQPEHFASIRAINDISGISFYWDANSQCTELNVGQDSFTDPKVWGGAPR